jgi:uncharacterized SAM-binding protein YcdF (DUF218 family)
MESLFFWCSKLMWMLLAPLNLVFISIVLITVLLWFKFYRASTIAMTLLTSLLTILAFIPIGSWLISPLETRFVTNPKLPVNVDGIIVLSGAELAHKTSFWNQVELGGSAERDLEFMKLARKYPEAKLVFTGGSSSLLDQSYKSADVAKRLFTEHGMDVERILFEKQARNTWENAVFSKELANPNIQEKWILITTGWHMPRSVGVFCKIGWKVIPFPVDHWTISDKLFNIKFSLGGHLSDLSIGLKEWIGLFVYYITDRSSDVLPDGCH